MLVELPIWMIKHEKNLFLCISETSAFYRHFVRPIPVVGTRNNVAVIISFYRVCFFNPYTYSVTTSTQKTTATGWIG